MSAEPSTPLAVADAHQILKQFDCLNREAIAAITDRAPICRALLTVAQQSDYQILGICADSLAEARHALDGYAAALGYTVSGEVRPIDGPVYLKYNPKSGLLYVDDYSGDHRGVLVSCQSASDTGLNDMYGHLPLHLFEPRGQEPSI